MDARRDRGIEPARGLKVRQAVVARRPDPEIRANHVAPSGKRECVLAGPRRRVEFQSDAAQDVWSSMIEGSGPDQASPLAA